MVTPPPHPSVKETEAPGRGTGLLKSDCGCVLSEVSVESEVTGPEEEGEKLLFSSCSHLWPEAACKGHC